MFKNFNIDNNKSNLTKRGCMTGVVIAFLILLFLWAYGGNQPKNPPDQKLDVETGVDIDTKDEDKQSYTEIPVFKTVVVSTDKPNVYLGNPEINHVYFRYKVTLKDESGGTDKDVVLYDNDAVIEPGRAFQVDIWKLVEPGTYDIDIDISTFDLETEEPCNGATQHAKLIVK